jgi:hypothetical protein
MRSLIAIDGSRLDGKNFFSPALADANPGCSMNIYSHLSVILASIEEIIGIDLAVTLHN